MLGHFGFVFLGVLTSQSLLYNNNVHSLYYLSIFRRLDYDFTELHRYQFTLSAIDGGEEPRQGFTQVQVWLDNVKDEKPVMEPPVQVSI